LTSITPWKNLNNPSKKAHDAEIINWQKANGQINNLSSVICPHKKHSLAIGTPFY
jgi:hypothetical protein